jgi:ribosomal protein L12E/L44/L45/RPP1/RPP2
VEERNTNEKRFLAALQGIDLDKEIEKNSEGTNTVSDGPKTVSSDNGYIFKDPKTYEGWTQEEKEAEDQKILGKLKAFVEHRPPGTENESGIFAPIAR